MIRYIPYPLFLLIVIGLLTCDKPTKEEKDADALFQKIKKTYTFNQDGSVDYRYSHELDLYSYYSFNKLYGETFIVYNPKFQDLTVNKSVTKTAEGKKIPSPENAYNQVLPGSAEGAPPYHHLREMVVTHTGLEKNSAIHLDYEITSDPGFKPFLAGNEVLAEKSPVRELVIEVRFPQDEELNYKLLNAQQKLNISKSGNYKEYRWVFKDLPPLENENQQPEFGQHLPRLIFSTEDFKTAYRYITGQFRDNLPAGISAKIEDAVKNSTGRMDSILEVRNMMVNHINHFDVPWKHTGYKLRSNEEVLEDNGGTTLEKTWLLTSLLNNIGVEATPVAIIPSEYNDQRIGHLDFPDKYYVKVPGRKETLYLSAVHENNINSKYRFSGETHLLIDKENQEPEYMDSEEHKSNFSIHGDFKISPKNKLTGRAEVQFSYCENPYFSIKRNENAVNSLLSPGFKASDIQEYKLDSLYGADRCHLQYSINKDLEPITKGNYWMLPIPEVQTGLDKWHTENLPLTRKTAFEIGWPLIISYTYNLEIPRDLRLVNDNINIEETGKAGSVSIQTRQDSTTVNIEKRLRLPKKLITPEYYKDFRELMTTWNNEKYNQLIFNQTNK